MTVSEKQSFPGPSAYLSPWGPPHYSCSTPFTSCTPRRSSWRTSSSAIPDPTAVIQAGSAHRLNSGKSLPQDETSSAEGSRDITINFSPSLSYPSELSKAMAQLSCRFATSLAYVPVAHQSGLALGWLGGDREA